MGGLRLEGARKKGVEVLGKRGKEMVVQGCEEGREMLEEE